jgi:hypothetical protein
MNVQIVMLEEGIILTIAHTKDLRNYITYAGTGILR